MPCAPTPLKNTPAPIAMPWDAVASESKIAKFDMDIDDLAVKGSGRFPTGTPLAFNCKLKRSLALFHCPYFECPCGP